MPCTVILRSLIERYTAPEINRKSVLLMVYSWHSGKGVDEGNIGRLLHGICGSIKTGIYIGKKT